MNLYKKFMLYFVGFLIVITCGIYPLFIYLQLGIPTESSRYLDEWFDIKYRYAATIQEPKVVVLSGSSTLFGIDATKLEAQYNIPTVNMGLHAGLGIEYIFYRVKQIARSGDTIILPLEYSHYLKSEELNETLLDYVLANDLKYLNSKTVIDKVKFLAAVQPKRIISGVKTKYLGNKKTIGNYDGIYLNKNGDMTNYEHPLNSKALMSMSVDDVFAKNINIANDSKACLLNFIAYCKANDIQLLATYPAFLYKDKEFSGNDLKMIKNIKRFWQENNIPILGRYEEFLYDVTAFYDTSYHLNAQGKEKNTGRLIEYLSPYIPIGKYTWNAIADNTKNSI